MTLINSLNNNISIISYYISLIFMNYVFLWSLFSGIILVHDLTNRKSQQNLQKWLAEVLNRESGGKTKQTSFDDFDPEQFVGSTQVCIVIVKLCH